MLENALQSAPPASEPNDGKRTALPAYAARPLSDATQDTTRATTGERIDLSAVLDESGEVKREEWCVCADPENCTESIPGKLCKRVHGGNANDEWRKSCDWCGAIFFGCDGETLCPKCESKLPDPAPSDRPEPSEALAMLDRISDFIGDCEHDDADNENNREVADRVHDCHMLRDFFSQPVPAVPEDVAKLANRCLWIAFAWNDHNFDGTPEQYAREEAKRIGIHDGESARQFMSRVFAAAPTPSEGVTHD